MIVTVIQTVSGTTDQIIQTRTLIGYRSEISIDKPGSGTTDRDHIIQTRIPIGYRSEISIFDVDIGRIVQLFLLTIYLRCHVHKLDNK